MGVWGQPGFYIINFRPGRAREQTISLSEKKKSKDKTLHVSKTAQQGKILGICKPGNTHSPGTSVNMEGEKTLFVL